MKGTSSVKTESWTITLSYRKSVSVNEQVFTSRVLTVSRQWNLLLSNAIKTEQRCLEKVMAS